MIVNLKSRTRVKLEQVDSGSAFMVVGERQKLFQVLDLSQTDAFKESPVLRNDLVYISEVETGLVSALPKNTDVELVEVEVSEI